MLSLTAVLASLPPASLAETDLPRFVAQTLGRRTRQELPGLASLFAEEPLRGYPTALGAVLASACEALLADHLDPQLLDSRSSDALLGSRTFLTRLENRTEVRRQRLRPGTLVAGELRQTLGTRLTILPGVGRELMLIAPVDLAQVPDARFAMPLTIVIAKPGSAAEGDIYRTHWAPIEEAFGLTGPHAQRWAARYFAIARRENHDARLVRDGLAGLGPDIRRRLWDTLVGHLRDTELPEQHRPGRRGLENRLATLGLELDRPWMEPLIGLTEAAYRAVGLDPDVSAGRCPCPREDLVRWSGWVDVPTAQKKRLMELEPAEIEHLLVALTETELGRADGLVEDALRRPLASLRDGCLRPRWQRSQAALTGIDPLALAEARIASGDDRQTIADRLAALAEEATAAFNARAADEPLPKTRKITVSASTPPALAPATESPFPQQPPVAPESAFAPESALATAPPSFVEPESTVAPTSESALGAAPAPQSVGHGKSRPPGATAGAIAPQEDGQETPAEIGSGVTDTANVSTVAPPRFQLPPMPNIPPPRPAPRVRPRTDFPALPPLPPAPTRAPARDRPTTGVGTAAVARDLTHTSRPPTARPAPIPAPTRPPLTLDVEPVPSRAPIPRAPASPARPRLQTTPHLVTPTQGNEFYDAAFRELELIERDLLQRGPTSHAIERTDVIGREARELHDALGPSARSGDRDFLAAQRRIDKVLDYLERLHPLLEGAPPPTSPSLGKRIIGLFRKR